MPTPLLVLIVLAILVAVGVGAYFAHLEEKKRTAALAALAEELGWAFFPDKDKSFRKRLPQFKAFQEGHSRFAHNRLTGKLSVESDDGSWVELVAEAGDYHYRVKQGKNTHTYRFSYLLIRAPCDPATDLVVRPENAGDKMKAMLGFDDIDFESIEFSDRFYVKSSDKRFAYDVIHPRMMEFLMGSNPPSIHIGNGVLCITHGKKRWQPPQFRQELEWTERFFALWPRHLVG